MTFGAHLAAMANLFDGPVADYASYGIVCVDVAAPLQEVARVIAMHGFSGVGVRDGAGPVIGIVTTTDVLAAVELETRADLGRFSILPTSRKAGEVMRTPVRVDDRATLREAARRMVAHHIQRVFVAQRDETVGVLSARDLLRAVVNARVVAPISTVMSAPIKGIGLNESVRTAIGQLVAANVHGLVVVDGDSPVGVFTHFEALRARALPQALLDSSVERVMSYEFVRVDALTPLHRVAARAVAMQLRRVLVTEGKTLRGIATALDLARYIADATHDGAKAADAG